MRCVIKRLALLAAALMLLTVPVLAVEGTMDKMLEQGQQGGKDECLLVAKNCGSEVDTIQQRIERIQKEIGRGTDVYTNDELKSLNRQLENEIKNLEELSTGGA
jgi:peptidoglycan hydrolase CwlO-like protein